MPLQIRGRVGQRVQLSLVRDVAGYTGYGTAGLYIGTGCNSTTIPFASDYACCPGSGTSVIEAVACGGQCTVEEGQCTPYVGGSTRYFPHFNGPQRKLVRAGDTMYWKATLNGDGFVICAEPVDPNPASPPSPAVPPLPPPLMPPPSPALPPSPSPRRRHRRRPRPAAAAFAITSAAVTAAAIALAAAAAAAATTVAAAALAVASASSRPAPPPPQPPTPPPSTGMLLGGSGRTAASVAAITGIVIDLLLLLVFAVGIRARMHAPRGETSTHDGVKESGGVVYRGSTVPPPRKGSNAWMR